jgi:hypothetical protein
VTCWIDTNTKPRLILFTLQLLSHSALYSSNTLYSHAAATLAPHHIASNLLLFGFLNLWVRSHFWLGLLLLVINFFNLTFAYFRYSTSPRLIHIGVVAGPLAWNFVALYWVGALAFGARHLAARIVANVFIWGILAYGSFFLVVFKDYTMGVSLSVLAFCESLFYPSLTSSVSTSTPFVLLHGFPTNMVKQPVSANSSPRSRSCNSSGSLRLPLALFSS